MVAAVSKLLEPLLVHNMDYACGWSYLLGRCSTGWKFFYSVELEVGEERAHTHICW